MLGASARGLAAAVIGSAAVLMPAVPAAGQIDPDPIDCQAGPAAAECRDQRRPPGGDSPPGDGQVCSFGGAQVPCRTPYGSWVGDVVDGDWYGLAGDVWPALLVGCWAMATSAERDPPSGYPGEAQSGTWHTLSCLGPGGSWPAPGPGEFGLAWTPDAAGGPDPEALARRALASIDLRVPALRLSPPATGSVLLGMPVWLAVEESAAAWGPISSGQVCEQGLCVEVAATAERVRWRTGDGQTTVDCTRDQNLAWEPGIDFLAPGNACHHYYTTPSREQPGGTFDVSATITWRAEWSGGGQSGTFTGIDDACGPDSDELCRSSVDVQVDEMHVLVQQ